MKKIALKNESGFGLVSFLALIPLLFAVLSFVVGLAMVLKTDAKLKHECRTRLLESQRSVSSRLNQILANNRIGSALRIERLAAEAAVKATIGVPPAHAAAQAELAAVKARQVLYKLEQQRLMLLAKSQTIYAPQRASYAVKAKLIEDAMLISNIRALPFSQTNHPLFELQETPQNNDSPDYVPARDFTTRQEMKFSMEFDLATILPPWLKAFLPHQSLKLKTECNATIEKENDKWIERLSAAR